ncbi:catalase [Acrasis kona]|uniref:Catalase n=1 Tax=Acrasis kona TaxID=1008807 RepID=A0AAW2ZPY0_9EUKA
MDQAKQLASAVTDKLSQAFVGMTDSTYKHAGTMTKLTGHPIGEGKHSITAGPQGPLVVDVQLLEKLQQFTREKIPPRNVHALGYGAYGEFTVTNDISEYTSADIFNAVGKKTPLFTRFSGIFTEVGDADTTRDPRGFAIKFYTKEGNWDLMGINTPVFAARDSKIGPDNVHAFKRDPRNGAWQSDQFWDFVALHPEGLHQVLMLYTDRTGTPMSWRTMNGYGCHTFSLLNKNGTRHWVKWHIISQQGARGFTVQQAKTVAGEDPNFLGRDLYNALESKQYPKWKLMMQIMPEADGYKNPWTFDCTKIWKHSDYPLIDVGEIVLNRNPTDYHSEVEQVAFAPTTYVPGMGLSPDKLLQGRLLIYDDTQYHRLGPNFKQLYINRAHGIEPMNNYVGGQHNQEIRNKFPHYYPSVFGGLQPDPKYKEQPMQTNGPADYYAPVDEYSDEDIYSQCTIFWNAIDDQQRLNMIDNFAVALVKVKEQKIVDLMINHLLKISSALGSGVRQKVEEKKAGKGKTAAELMVDNFAKDLMSINSSV